MGYLREAAEQDMDLLFHWANEKSVRENSFSTKYITYEEHQRWFKNFLKRDDAKQYIYMHDGEAVGQTRVVIEGERAEIGYSICSQKRGMGHGKEMIQLIKERVKQDFPRVKKLTARVKPENIVSQKVFLDMGYSEKYQFYELEIRDVERG